MTVYIFRRYRWSEPWGGATLRIMASVGRWQFGVEVHPRSGWGRGGSYLLSLLRSGIDQVQFHAGTLCLTIAFRESNR